MYTLSVTIILYFYCADLFLLVLSRQTSIHSRRRLRTMLAALGAWLYPLSRRGSLTIHQVCACIVLGRPNGSFLSSMPPGYTGPHLANAWLLFINDANFCSHPQLPPTSQDYQLWPPGFLARVGMLQLVAATTLDSSRYSVSLIMVQTNLPKHSNIYARDGKCILSPFSCSA